MGKDLEILNKADVLPLDFNQENSEEQRLKYRYLDLRRPEMTQKIKFRAKITSAVRQFLDNNGFLDIETPILTKATPEGARDYLVPSHPQRQILCLATIATVVQAVTHDVGYGSLLPNREVFP